MAPQITEEDSKLIADLHALSKRNPKLVKSTDHVAPADSNIIIQSWKMNEFKYYDIPSPFPTLARGLFTTKLEDSRDRIVVRGYDKFFNIGEVPWTSVCPLYNSDRGTLLIDQQWSSLEARTGAPYTLTLKSNGCIIFIASLSPSKILVTSKHSLGAGANAQKSHAIVGQKWLQKHLASKGKTEEELAATLWKNNWTAIAEVH